jgi:hypothetical protein
MHRRLSGPVAGLVKTVWANGPGVRLAALGICTFFLWSSSGDTEEPLSRQEANAW